MAVAELPLPPFPYEKDFFGSPFPKGGKKKRFADFRKEIEQGEIKRTNKKKKLKKYSEHLTKHLRLRQRIVFKIKHSKTISSPGKFPKNQLTPNGLPAHQIKQNTKDKLSQAKWIFGLKTNRSVIKGEAYYV